MIATCRLCKELIAGTRAYTYRAPMLGESMPEYKLSRQVAEFDYLATAMLTHIMVRHARMSSDDPAEPPGLQVNAVMALAGKTYAMTYAETATDAESVRKIWRHAIGQALFPDAYVEDEAGAPAASLSFTPPSGS